MSRTPGPWYVVSSAGQFWIEAAGSTSIAHVMPIRGGEANAELLAAAPDLLATLKALADVGEDMTIEKLAAARAAIAKAEGRS